MKKISEESVPSERKMIYKIGLIIAAIAIIAWFGFNDLSNQVEVPAPKDTQLLQAYAIINNSTETMRENSYNMTRAQTVGLADWLSDADEGGPGCLASMSSGSEEILSERRWISITISTLRTFAGPTWCIYRSSEFEDNWDESELLQQP